MRFNQYRTIFEVSKQKFGKIDGKFYQTPDTFYANALAGSAVQAQILKQDVTRSEMIQCAAEFWFHFEGKPYFNLHPSLVLPFTKARMDIPASLLVFPADFKSFAIQLPSPEEGNPLKVDDQGHYVKSFLCHRSNPDIVAEMLKILKLPPQAFRVHPGNRLLLWMDINETIPTQLGPEAVYTWRQLAYSGEDTIEQALHKLPVDNDYVGIPASDTWISQCIRLMMSVCFLVESHDPLILPDVLAKDRYRLGQADEKELAALHEKAKKANKFGWSVGTEIFGNTPQRVPEGHGAHELSFAHIRQGHWHEVLWGEKKSKRRIMWYRPVTVRPDLPFEWEKP